MTDIDIPALKAAVQLITRPLSASWMAGGIRHLVRNVDYDAFWDPASEDGESPDRYEGEHMAVVLNSVPKILERLEKLEAVAKVACIAMEHGAYRQCTGEHGPHCDCLGTDLRAALAALEAP